MDLNSDNIIHVLINIKNNNIYNVQITIKDNNLTLEELYNILNTFKYVYSNNLKLKIILLEKVCFKSETNVFFVEIYAKESND